MLDALPDNTREVVTLVLSRGTVDHAGGGAIFDRDHIIHEQELLDAGDQLVAYLAQRAQAAPTRRRPHAASPAARRTAPPLRLVRRGTA